MSMPEAVKQAKYAFENKAAANKETRINNVIELAEWGVFSNQHLSMLTGMRAHDVAEYTGKTDRTGGNLSGASLAPILDIIATKARGEVDDSAVKRALDAGASTRMVSRLTGIAQSTVARQGRRAA